MHNLGQAFVSASQFGLRPFDLARPTSLIDVEDLLKVDDAPCYLAGGTDLFVQFREGLRPDLVIDINGIEDLSEIYANEETLTIGAGVHHEEGVQHSLVSSNVPGLETAWALFGNVRTRGMGTLGGNLMARRERYEGPIIASALNAELGFLGADGSTGHSMADVWADSQPAGALLTYVSIPVAGRPRLAYDRSLRPVFTMAAVVEEASGGGLSGRAVMGFEWDQPLILDLDLTGAADGKAIVASSEDIASTAFGNFPVDRTDSEYLIDAGTAVLSRLLVQLGEPS